MYFPDNWLALKLPQQKLCIAAEIYSWYYFLNGEPKQGGVCVMNSKGFAEKLYCSDGAIRNALREMKHDGLVEEFETTFYGRQSTALRLNNTYFLLQASAPTDAQNAPIDVTLNIDSASTGAKNTSTGAEFAPTDAQNASTGAENTTEKTPENVDTALYAGTSNNADTISLTISSTTPEERTGIGIPEAHASMASQIDKFPPPEPIPLRVQYDVLLAQLRDAKTQPNSSQVIAGLLGKIYVLCHGKPPPDLQQGFYARLKKLALEAGGAGRFAELLWHTTTKQLTDNPLDYIQKQLANQKKNNGNGYRKLNGAASTDASDYDRSGYSVNLS